MALGQTDQGWVLSSGSILKPSVVGNVYNSVTITSAQGTTPQLIITGAPGYVLTEIGVQVDDISTIGTAGMISTRFTDSNFGDMFVIRWYVPSTFAPKTGPANNRQVSGPGFYWNNKLANSTLSVSTDTALTAGSIRFFARYALVNFIG